MTGKTGWECCEHSVLARFERGARRALVSIGRKDMGADHVLLPALDIESNNYSSSVLRQDLEPP